MSSQLAVVVVVDVHLPAEGFLELDDALLLGVDLGAVEGVDAHQRPGRRRQPPRIPGRGVVARHRLVGQRGLPVGAPFLLRLGGRRRGAPPTRTRLRAIQLADRRD